MLSQQLGSLASDRLGEYRRLLVAAILRAFNGTFVPEDYLQEPINGTSRDVSPLTASYQITSHAFSTKSPLVLGKHR